MIDRFEFFSRDTGLTPFERGHQFLGRGENQRRRVGRPAPIRGSHIGNGRDFEKCLAIFFLQGRVGSTF